MLDIQLDASKAALLVIDVQNDTVSRLASAPSFVDAIARLVDGMRRRRCPIVWVRVERRVDMRDVADVVTQLTVGDRPKSAKNSSFFIEGSAGAQLARGLEAAETDFHVVKRRVSAFHGTPLDTYLRCLDVRTLLVCGAFTHMGVESTVRAAWDHDYETIVISDACASPDRELHRWALTRVMPTLARVMTTNRLFRALGDDNS